MVRGGLEYKVSMAGKLYLGNAFSLSMLSKNKNLVSVKVITIEDVKKLLENEFTSVVGHESTASILSDLLSKEVKVNRVSVKLNRLDKLIVFQLLQQRLPEGKLLTKDELQKINYKFYLVEIIEETD